MKSDRVGVGNNEYLNTVRFSVSVWVLESEMDGFIACIGSRVHWLEHHEIHELATALLSLGTLSRA
jgi:hypothetical protein